MNEYMSTTTLNQCRTFAASHTSRYINAGRIVYFGIFASSDYRSKVASTKAESIFDKQIVSFHSQPACCVLVS